MISDPAATDRVEDLLRPLVPQVLGAIVRRFGHFDLAEDAVQDALLAAVDQWPRDGIPERPRAWLITVASRRLTDRLRAEEARRRREEAVVATGANSAFVAAAVDDDERPPEHDDTLVLLFLCCHPSLSPPSQLALTLRAVGGLTTAEIARAFLVPEATMAQRISRAKATIAAAGLRFRPPPPDEREARLAVVLHVLYLVFNEGYTASSGESLVRDDLAHEAIRLTRAVHGAVPDDGEVAGLLALMLLTDARRGARTAPDGALIPLDEQDRSRWDAATIAEGVDLVTTALATGPLGPYQLQAAIAAVHDEAPSTDDTDWPQVVALYDLLERVSPNPMARLNRAIAVAMVEGPDAGLALVDAVGREDGLAEHHRVLAVRAHLLERAGDLDAASAAYREAARRTTSRAEQRHLDARANRLSVSP